jgi:hypothetical protein
MHVTLQDVDADDVGRLRGSRPLDSQNGQGPGIKMPGPLTLVAALVPQR